MRTMPFRIEIPQSAVDHLHGRLRATAWPEDFDNEDWRYGTNLAFIRRLASYWLETFDWRRAERDLNALPQFTAEIDGLPVHFVHIRGREVNSAPLILTHGWPGSFAEMVKIAPLLTDPAHHGLAGHSSFDLVIPSLPGFGFSAAPNRPGINARAVALTWHRLMDGLGYQKYFAQGGDIGAGVSTWLARLFTDSVMGIHLNFIPGSYQPYLGAGTEPLSDEENRWLAARAKWLDEEGAYSHLQSTKPQTLAYGLTDSPVALASWVVEKFRAWSDCDGDVVKRFSLDELLTNVSIYWFSRNIGATLRIYKENRGSLLTFSEGERLAVPMSFAAFPKEICPPPREWVERAYRVAAWTKMPAGGHFAAMEEPVLLAESIHEAFRRPSAI
jgi:pimeloyl-ACP methyl ester carboxylesterase